MLETLIILALYTILITIFAYILVNIGKYNKQWDEMLKILLRKNIDNLTEYTVIINGIGIWIGNFPYSYGCVYGTELYPSLITRIKLYKKIKKYREELNQKMLNDLINKDM